MSSEPHTYERLYREIVPSVVSIYTNITGDPHGEPQGTGSGFIYDTEHIITNQHVVADPRTVEVRFSEGDWRTGHVAGTDAYTDLAVVRIESLPEDAAALPITAKNPTPGQPVVAFGNPMGLEGTMTTGIVSGVNRSMRTGRNFTIPDTIQTDAPINPGNSGGPLVTLEGTVVGVNRARAGDNIGFAISPAIASRVVPDLIEHGTYRHSFLDIRTVNVSPTVAEANSLDEPRGILVVDVSLGPASGALKESAGSRQVRSREVPVGGDIIVGVDDHEINSHEELMRYLITETRPGESVTVDLVRDGRELTEQITLGERRPPGTQVWVRQRRDAAPSG